MPSTKYKDSKPFLLLLYGSSAVGKTTIAKRLLSDFGIPYVGLDDIKETLYDCGFSESDKNSSKLLNIACFEASIAIIKTMFEAGQSVVVDFHRKEDLVRLEQLSDDMDARFISVYFVMTDEDMRRKRYNYRILSGERHPGHNDVPHKSTKHEPIKEYKDKIQPDIIIDTGTSLDESYGELVNELRGIIDSKTTSSQSSMRGRDYD